MGALLRRYRKSRCWDDQRYHNRRSYYRHRDVRNRHRKQNDKENREPPKQAQRLFWIFRFRIHWYRETKDAPLHALGAELWMGNDRLAKIESVHCLGLTEL